MLLKTKKIFEVNDWVNFLLNHTTEKEIKEIFGINKVKFNDFYIGEWDKFLEDTKLEGWADEDIIKLVLEKRKEKYHINYVDDNNGYFEISEVEE